jgi:hypothetical protein
MEIGGSIGLIIGPLIGTALNIAGGFSMTFYVLTAIFVLWSVGVYFLVGPNREYVKS